MFEMIVPALAVLLLLAFLIVGCDSSSNRPVIKIEKVWSRPVIISTQGDSAPNSGYNGAVYLTIKNSGGVSDRLMKAKTEKLLKTIRN